MIPFSGPVVPVIERIECDCSVEQFPVGNVVDGWHVNALRRGVYDVHLHVTCPNHPNTTRTITLPKRR